MSKLMAGNVLREHHARLAKDGRLGDGMIIEIGAYLDDIKGKRRKQRTALDAGLTYDPNNPAYEAYALVDRPSGNAPPSNPSVATLPDEIERGFGAIAEVTARTRAAKARLSAHSRAVSAKSGQAGTDLPGRPTDEYVAKSGGEGAFDISIAGRGERAPLRRYVLRAPTTPFKDIILPEVDEAFTRFADDAEAAGIVRVTANYDGISGGARGSRVGGLGDVDEARREAYARHEYRMRALADRMDTPGSRVTAIQILAWAVIRERMPDGRALSMLELGRRLCPGRSNEEYLRGAAYQAIEMVGRALCNIDHDMARGNLRVNGGAGVMSVERLKRIGGL